MKLSAETAATINLGDVVKFSWKVKELGIVLSITGVIFENNSSGIKCNREKFGCFGLNSSSFDGIDFEFVNEHPPVAEFDGEFDFVNKHM